MDELEKLYYLSKSIGAVGTFVQLVVSVLILVARWCVLNKAGEGGWKVLIPIYGEYIWFKIAGCAKRFWIQFVLSFLAVAMGIVIVKAIIDFNTELLIISSLATAVLAVAALIIGITVNFKMAKAFGLSGAFGLGLWWLPVIFVPILGFSGSIQYQLYRGSPIVQGPEFQ